MKVLLPLAFLLLCGGCAIKPVHPWERGHLARPEMALEPDAMQAAVRDHTYVSKEGASGGAALAGGGCGCN